MACVPFASANFMFRPFLVKSGDMAALQIVLHLALSPGSSCIFPSLFMVAAASLLQGRSLITCIWCFTSVGCYYYLKKHLEQYWVLEGLLLLTSFLFRSFWGGRRRGIIKSMALSPPLSLPLHPNPLLHDGFVWFCMHSGCAGKHFSDSVCLPIGGLLFCWIQSTTLHPYTDLEKFHFRTFIFTTMVEATLTFWGFFLM